MSEALEPQRRERDGSGCGKHDNRRANPALHAKPVRELDDEDRADRADEHGHDRLDECPTHGAREKNDRGQRRRSTKREDRREDRGVDRVPMADEKLRCPPEGIQDGMCDRKRPESASTAMGRNMFTLAQQTARTLARTE